MTVKMAMRLAVNVCLNLNVATMEPALRYQAIQSGDIQITDAYSTDAELARYDLQVLEDDKQLFPPYQGAPLMKEALLKKHPELETVLNKLASKITESQMSQLNYQVGVEGKSAEQVAKGVSTRTRFAEEIA